MENTYLFPQEFPFIFISMRRSDEWGNPFVMGITREQAMRFLEINRCSKLAARKAVETMENPKYEGRGRTITAAPNWLEDDDDPMEAAQYREENWKESRVVAKIVPTWRIAGLTDYPCD